MLKLVFLLILYVIWVFVQTARNAAAAEGGQWHHLQAGARDDRQYQGVGHRQEGARQVQATATKGKILSREKKSLNKSLVRPIQFKGKVQQVFDIPVISSIEPTSATD